MNSSNMELENSEIFNAGMAAGRKGLEVHIQHQYEIGKPVEINGELYWLKDGRENLNDIMDDIESTWNEEHGLSKFIVPIKKHSCNNEEIVRELIIQALSAEEAMEAAITDFEDNGWIVDKNYINYKRLG